jgi:signal transduction histidine kinase
MAVTSSFLHAYRVDGMPAARLERVLGVGRAFLTVTALGAIYLDPTEPSRLAAVTYGVLAAYALYSTLVLVWIQSGPPISPLHGRLLHGTDILWTSALTFVSEGPVSPFFLFFLFVVAASAYRWGFRETVATAILTIAVFLLETVLATIGPWNRTWLSGVAFELNVIILRVAYLFLTGFLLGYLAEQEKQSRAELAALADLPRQTRVDLGLRESVTSVAKALERMFTARAAAIVLLDHNTSLASLWVWPEGTHVAGPAVTRRELDPVGREAWLFEDPGRSWHAAVPRPDALAVFHVIDADAWALKRIRGRLPPILAATIPSARTVTAANLGLSGEWTGRIYLFDIAPIEDLERAVHFLNVAMERIAPILSNVFLLRRVRSQDTAAERAKVARELHDGVIQTLFGIEMKLEALKRRSASAPPGLPELEAIQELVRGEVRALRQLMRALRPIELDANEKLADVLIGVVERFRRDSGMSARFVLSGDAPSLGPGAALEVVRIVQEALANARKHSRASNVLVRLSQNNGHHDLLVEDDGQGFPFEGRLSAAELDARRIGPAIIKERARVLGADLAVESTRGVGARIEVTLRGAS